MGKLDAVGMGMGVVRGAFDAGKTYCENQKKIEQVDKAVKGQQKYLTKLDDLAKDMEKEHIDFMAKLALQTKDFQNDLIASKKDFKKKKKFITILLIVILVVIVVLLLAKTLHFFTLIKKIYDKYLKI